MDTEGGTVLPFDASRPRRAHQQAPEGDWRDSLVYTQKGKVESITANVTTILLHDESWEGVLAWDDHGQAAVFRAEPPWCPDDQPLTAQAGQDFAELDTVRVQSWMARRYNLRINKEQAWDGVQAASRRVAYHPIREWLDSLEWDGTLRISGWLATYAGATDQDAPYLEMVARSLLISAVARVYDPGCKVDTMPVLEGRQGIGKSTLCKTLFGSRWFSDTPVDLNSKDRFLPLRRRWAVEFAELDSLGRSDIARVKTFLSSACDDYRPPYGRTLVSIPRQCVFVGTVNDSTYLRDETGNRRFFPVKCRWVDNISLERIREQLWAEAREAYRGGAKWHPETKQQVELANTEQVARLQTDAWQPIIADYVRAQLDLPITDRVFTATEILDKALKLDVSKWGPGEQSRVARCLNAMRDERDRPLLEYRRFQTGIGNSRKQYRGWGLVVRSPEEL